MGLIQPAGRKQKRASATPFMMDIEEVARVAYTLYEQRGRNDGYALDDWLKAEGIVRHRHANGNNSRS